jgi:AcrR family transcriptional regulator
VGRRAEAAAGEGPKAQQALQTRRRLVAVARRLFARDGYAAVSLAQIAPRPP